jgi:hypothetical protein
VNFYGHFTHHTRRAKIRGGLTTTGYAGAGQVTGPISYGARDFIAASHSTNKYLSAPEPTIRVLTPRRPRAPR